MIDDVKRKGVISEIVRRLDGIESIMRKLGISAFSGGGGSSSVASNPSNLLINGGFDFFQRTITPTVAISMTNDVYNAPDRFYSLVQGAGATIAQNAGIGTSRYSCKIVAGGTTNRYGIAQIVKGSESIPYRGKTVIAQIRVKPVNNAGSGTRVYRIAILEWTGTIDTVTSELVANWASGTFTTAGFFASTTKTLVATANVTATHNAESVLSVSGTVSTSCNNLIVFVWTENAPTHAADYALFGEFGLYLGSQVVAWSPRPISEEFVLCQAHYEVLGQSSTPLAFAIYGYMGASGWIAFTYSYKVEKFYQPTGYVLGTWAYGGSTGAGDHYVTCYGTSTFTMWFKKDGSTGNYYVYTNSTDARLVFVCEL